HVERRGVMLCHVQAVEARFVRCLDEGQALVEQGGERAAGMLHVIEQPKLHSVLGCGSGLRRRGGQEGEQACTIRRRSGRLPPVSPGLLPMAIPHLEPAPDTVHWGFFEPSLAPLVPIPTRDRLPLPPPL